MRCNELLGEKATATGVRQRTAVDLPVAVTPGVVHQASIITFHGLRDGAEHVALVFGPVGEGRVPLVRVHSECLTGDVFGSMRCDCGPQLRESISLLHAQGGIVIYLRQEGRGIGLYNKIDAYALQSRGYDTYEANVALDFPADARRYDEAAQMLLALNVKEVRLLSNNPAKVQQLEENGVIVHQQQPTGVYLTEDNRRYLQAKVTRAGHSLTLEENE